MKVAVIGSRDFTDKERLYFELDELKKIYRDKLEIVSGCEDNEKNLKASKGADQFALQWAREKGVIFTGLPADWKDMSPPCRRMKNEHGEYNAAAGHKRNQKIAEYSTQCLAFWDGSSTGTEDCMDRFEGMKKKVRIIKFNR